METIDSKTRQIQLLNANTVRILYHDNTMIELDDVIEDYDKYDMLTEKNHLKKWS